MQNYGNFRERTRALGFVRHRAWACCFVAFALVAAALIRPAGAVEVEMHYFGPTTATVSQLVRVEKQGQGSLQVTYGGSTSNVVGFTTRTRIKQGIPISGLSAGNTPVSASSTLTGYDIVWTSGDLGGVVVIPEQSISLTVHHTSSHPYSNSAQLDVLTVYINTETGEVVVDDPHAPEPEPEPEKDYEKGILFLENNTGVEQTIVFGDELLTLEPGGNSFPFQGETVEGFPAAAPEQMIMNRSIGADGQTYWTAQLQNAPEGGSPIWVSPAVEPQIFPPVSPNAGPTIKLPNGMTAMDAYYQLPPGMTAGNNNTLPPGMTAGSPGLPPGVTPGSSGALPNGVVSGGSNYLPPGISPGSALGQNPGASGGGGGTTGVTGSGNTAGVIQSAGGSQAVIGGGDPENPALFGYMSPDIGALEADKKAGASKMLESVQGLGDKASGLFGEGGFKTWQAPDSWSGWDTSWTDFEIPLADHTANIKIKPEWISLIRSILHWAVKIWFVIACLKLVMR